MHGATAGPTGRSVCGVHCAGARREAPADRGWLATDNVCGDWPIIQPAQVHRPCPPTDPASGTGPHLASGGTGSSGAGSTTHCPCPPFCQRAQHSMRCIPARCPGLPRHSSSSPSHVLLSFCLTLSHGRIPRCIAGAAAVPTSLVSPAAARWSLSDPPARPGSVHRRGCGLPRCARALPMPPCEYLRQAANPASAPLRPLRPLPRPAHPPYVMPISPIRGLHDEPTRHTRRTLAHPPPPSPALQSEKVGEGAGSTKLAYLPICAVALVRTCRAAAIHRCAARCRTPRLTTPVWSTPRTGCPALVAGSSAIPARLPAHVSLIAIGTDPRRRRHGTCLRCNPRARGLPSAAISPSSGRTSRAAAALRVHILVHIRLFYMPPA